MILNMIFPNSIECVNFEFGTDTITLRELMLNMVYSETGRYAVSFKTPNRWKKSNKALYILDSKEMKINQYIEKETSEIDIRDEMDVLYWYEDIGIVSIYADCEEMKFRQTLILLDHEDKTMRLNSIRSYDFSIHGVPFAKCRYLPLEGRTVVLQKEKYVVWISSKTATGHCSVVYAFPYKPSSSSLCKKFLIPLANNFIFQQQKSPEILNHLGKNIGPRRDHWRPVYKGNVSFADSVAYFPCYIEHYQGKTKQVLGIYGTIDFELLADIYNEEINETAYRRVKHFFIKRQGGSWNVVECVPEDKSTIKNHLQKPGPSRQYGKNFINITQRRKDYFYGMREETTTNVFFTDFGTKTVTSISYWRENIGRKDQLRCTCSLTPHNIIIAIRDAPTKFFCKTITLPIGNSIMSLENIAARYSYLNAHNQVVPTAAAPPKPFSRRATATRLTLKEVCCNIL